jgi:hypothetical protein
METIMATTAEKRKEAGRKAAKKRGQRAAGKKAARKRKQRLAGMKAANTRKLRQAAKTEIEAEIRRQEEATNAFGVDTSDEMLELAAVWMRLIRQKIEAFAPYLQDETNSCFAALEATAKKLRRRICLIGEAKEADGYLACEHCGAPNPLTRHQKTRVCGECGRNVEVKWE